RYSVCTKVNTGCTMRFEWDESKNQINIRKHGIDFNDVSDIFQHPILSQRDTRTDYDEERWSALAG
ncbi:BrnT family toxin, partial [Staphylococcus aureus]